MSRWRAGTRPPRALLRGIPITVWMLALVIVPLAFTFVMSFYSSRGPADRSRRLTLKNYALFFTDPMSRHPAEEHAPRPW